MEAKDIKLRSNEVQEILTKVPNWIIRWGISVIMALIVLLLFVSWFVKYPDIIAGEITITTDHPPIKEVSKFSGKISKLFVRI